MTTEFLHVTIAQLACPWWRHQMETFSTLLAICAGNSPVTGEFPPQRPVTQSFDVFFDLHSDEWFPGWMVPGWKIVPCVRKCKACNKKIRVLMFITTQTAKIQNNHSKKLAHYSGCHHYSLSECIIQMRNVVNYITRLLRYPPMDDGACPHKL